MTTTDAAVMANARKWLDKGFDEETRQKVQDLMDNNPAELTDAFYRNLEFGTGGLRGIMGVGTNRMNKYTVAMSTQGLANYLRKVLPQGPISAAIAHDSRNNSVFFSRVASEILSANGIKVYLFDSMRPTPLLSFAVRELKCSTGIVVTASHNPKEYNGYKVYWSDGAQLVSPHDTNVIDEVLKIKTIDEVNFNADYELITMIGEDIDALYLDRLITLSLNPEIIQSQSDLSIVFTPLHGTGLNLVPAALHRFGFKNVITVKEQTNSDGNFPTVHSPNPEESAALEMALNLAAEVKADLVMATDPDADRVGIAVPDGKGGYVLLNGNQTASILLYYILNQWKEKGKLRGNEYIVKTIVTSELLKDMADDAGVECFDVLTGFKYIADIIRSLEGQKNFIAGGEESYGYLIGDFVRDKDAVSSCCMIAETLAWAKSQNMTLLNLLTDIYLKFGFYKEGLVSITRKGKSGAEEIQQMMQNFRSMPPAEICGVKVSEIRDYKLQKITNMETGAEISIPLPVSDVLQFMLADGSKISVRPSGTEPKIKFYFGVKGSLSAPEDYEATDRKLQQRIDEMVAFMNP